MSDLGTVFATMRVQFRPDAMHQASLLEIPESLPLIHAGSINIKDDAAAQTTVNLLQSDGIAPCLVVLDNGDCHAGVFYDPNVFSDEDADRELWNIWEVQSLH